MARVLKVEIKRKGGQPGRDSQFKSMDLGCEEVGERGSKGSTFCFGSGKVTARRVPSLHLTVHQNHHNSPATPESFAVATP